MSPLQKRLLALVACVALALALGSGAWLSGDPDADPAADGHAQHEGPDGPRRHGPLAGDAEGSDGPTGLPWQRARASISGHVRDDAGHAVAGADVCLWSSHATLPSVASREPACVQTERDGHYRIEGVPAVEAEIHAAKRGYLPAVFEREREYGVPMVPGVERKDIDLVLVPGGVEIAGVVKDLSGGVVEGAFVTVAGTKRMAWREREPRAIARTLADGTFKTWGPEGDVVVRAHADGYGDSSRTGVAPGYTFELFLTPESVLVGRVVMAGTTTPVANAIVSGSATAFGPGGTGRAVTDADGRFRIDRLEPGRYHPRAEADEGYGRAATSVTVGLAETSEEILIELHPAAVVAGRVLVDGGEGCPSGMVSLSRADDPMGGAWSQLESDGAFRIRGVQPATYDVRVDCRDFVTRTDVGPLEVGTESIEGLEWTVERGLSARGTVVDGSGAAVVGANVIASAKVGGRGTGDRRYVATKTEADGSFTVQGLVAGDYGLEVRAQGFRSTPDRVDFSVAEGEAPAPIEVVLDAGGTVAGTVRDQNGEAVSGATVRVEGDWSATGKTADDGTFSIDAVEVGDRRIVASLGWRENLRAPGSTDDSLQGEAVKVAAGETTTVDLVVEVDDGEISGTVVDADGGPIVDAFIDKQRESDSAAAASGSSRSAVHWSGWDAQPVLTDPDGGFSLSDLPAGKYTLRAYRKGGGEGIVEHIDVGSTGVTITLADSGELRGKVTLAGGGVPDKFDVTVNDKAQGIWVSDSFFRTEGVFAFDTLPAGEYEVSVTSPVGDASTTAALAPGGVVDDIALELTPRVTATGRLLDLETREPVPGMQVSISPRKGSRGFAFGGKGDDPNVTDDAGRFTVDNAPAGRVRMMIVPRDFGDETYGWTNTYGAIPIDVDSYDLGDLYVVRSRKKRSAEDGDLGFKLEERPPDVEPEEHPRRVAFVRPGGPAETAGLKVGDVIISVDGHDITAVESYSIYTALTNVGPGTTIELGLDAGGTRSLTASPKP